MPLESPYIEPLEQHKPDKSAPEVQHQPRIRTRPLDTSEEADRIQIEIYRAMSPARRFEIAGELNEMCRDLQRTGIRQRHPEYTDREVHIARSRLILGEKLFAMIHPESKHILP
jgi:hypothetical protein